MQKEEALASVLCDTSPIQVPQFEYRGKTIRIEAWPLTHEKAAAIKKKSTTYTQTREGIKWERDLERYRIEYLRALVKDTNIPGVPGEGGWRRLPADLGDRMFEAVSVALEPTPEEVAEGKAQSNGEAEPSTPPASEKPSTSTNESGEDSPTQP